MFFLSSDFWMVKNPSAIKAFGVQLRRLRESKGLSQQELADLADIAKITVQRIENAKYSVTLDILISISDALGISPSNLVDFQFQRDKRE